MVVPTVVVMVAPATVPAVVMVVVMYMPIAAAMVSIVHVNVHSLRASNGGESYSKRGCNNKSKLLHSNASGYK